MKRQRLGVARDPLQSKAKIGSALLFAIFCVIVFHNLGINNNGGLTNPFLNSQGSG